MAFTHIAILYLLPISVTYAAARVVPIPTPFQKRGGEIPFSDTPIFDTSKYGILQIQNGLAQTPQMGWNSWNFFACNINETVIKETADALISTGLAELGYIYVNIDDCWSAMKRNSKDLDAYAMACPMTGLASVILFLVYQLLFVF